MSKKLVYPRRDADGHVIKPNTLTIPVMYKQDIFKCSMCKKWCTPTIVNGMCDECALEYGRNVRETVKDGEQ